MTRLLVVEHEADAPAGLLGGWAAAGGLAVTTVRLHAGDPLLPAGACDAAVVLGSEQTAYDDAVPWLEAELAFVDRLLAGEVPVLGICFGAQVLARVLGARLYRLSEPEIGWIRVTSKHPGLAEGPWPSWHVQRLRPAGRRHRAGGQRGLPAGVHGRPARRGPVPPGGDPADRRVLARERGYAAGPGGHRPVVQGR